MGRRTLLAILTLFTAGAAAQAQQVGRIAGRVTAAEGQYLPGIQIFVVGSTRGAVSDSAGRFTITDVPVGQQTVRATRLGFKPATQAVTVAAGETATVNLQMTPAAIQLDGVVTVGYGSQNRREVTGAVSTINADVLQQVVGGNPLDAIKGRVPGVDITSTRFDPGAAQNIRIRGTRSITASNAPLYVIDGLQITGDLRDIDQNSIETINVLKDASAAAAYG